MKVSAARAPSWFYDFLVGSHMVSENYGHLYGATSKTVPMSKIQERKSLGRDLILPRLCYS